jgi:hypothetical protein
VRASARNRRPLRYTDVADRVSKAEYDDSATGVAEGFAKWLDSIGPVKAARFFVLPGEIVRYEIASAHQYRVGLWKQKWAGGLLTEFSPIEETVVTAPAPLFREITLHAFRALIPSTANCATASLTAHASRRRERSMSMDTMERGQISTATEWTKSALPTGRTG